MPKPCLDVPSHVRTHEASVCYTMEMTEVFVVKTSPGKLEISDAHISGTFGGQTEIQHSNVKLWRVS